MPRHNVGHDGRIHNSQSTQSMDAEEDKKIIYEWSKQLFPILLKHIDTPLRKWFIMYISIYNNISRPYSLNHKTWPEEKIYHVDINL